MYTTTVGGLPTNIGGTTHHCLRMSFLNGANVAGTIASTDGDGSNKRAGTASWASNIYTFACTANPAWTADDHKGRLVKFLDASDNFLFSFLYTMLSCFVQNLLIMASSFSGELASKIINSHLSNID